jgi:hypothetical protein
LNPPWIQEKYCGILEERGKYDDVRDYTLTVKLASDNAYVPDPFSKKIEEIINQAKQE